MTRERERRVGILIRMDDDSVTVKTMAVRLACTSWHHVWGAAQSRGLYKVGNEQHATCNVVEVCFRCHLKQETYLRK